MYKKIKIYFYYIIDYGLLLANIKNSFFTEVIKNQKKINYNKLYAKY